MSENNIKLAKAKKAVSDATMLLLETIANLEEVIAADSYQRGHDDGVEYMREELLRLGISKDEPALPITPFVPTEIDKIVHDSIISHLTDNPGLRTIDISNKVIVLPVKPSLTEKQIRLAVNRLKNSGKIEDKAGRWYIAGAKKPPAQDYQVMRYLPDGSKYLAADVIKS